MTLPDQLVNQVLGRVIESLLQQNCAKYALPKYPRSKPWKVAFLTFSISGKMQSLHEHFSGWCPSLWPVEVGRSVSNVCTESTPLPSVSICSEADPGWPIWQIRNCSQTVLSVAWYPGVTAKGKRLTSHVCEASSASLKLPRVSGNCNIKTDNCEFAIVVPATCTYTTLDSEIKIETLSWSI